MSPTFEDDKSMTETWNLIWKYVKNYDEHVFNWVKMDVIQKIWDKQKAQKLNNE